ncbi:hypothetical protein [Acinetobacter colistiniresistens]|uniref:hypothetical protein n=1 Tax=Acinetobacter colistiniresistens TaxID=280145 RepID=UPI001250732B|nr:hypothetical protein [Acinetobacter colistiniresistens]
MFPDHLFPKLTKRDKVRAAKRRRKYNSKYRKWALRILSEGHILVCGTSTLCLDCGSKNYAVRLGCSCWNPEDKDAKGVIHGVDLVVEVGKGIKTPLAKKTQFLSLFDMKNKMKNNERFYDLSERKEILLNNI